MKGISKAVLALLVIVLTAFMLSTDSPKLSLNPYVITEDGNHFIILDLPEIEAGEVRVYSPNGLIIYRDSIVKGQKHKEKIQIQRNGVYWFMVKNGSFFLSKCLVVNTLNNSHI